MKRRRQLADLQGRLALICAGMLHQALLEELLGRHPRGARIPSEAYEAVAGGPDSAARMQQGARVRLTRALATLGLTVVLRTHLQGDSRAERWTREIAAELETLEQEAAAGAL